MQGTYKNHQEMPDPVRRQWQLLRAIPRAPQRRSTAELHQFLLDQGYSVTLRSTQRDLNGLSVDWGIVNDVEGRASYWYWPEGFGVLDVPGLDASQAIVFHLAYQYLRPALPQSHLRHLSPYFKRSEELLNKEGGSLRRWRERVRVIHRGPLLPAPPVPSGVMDCIHQALLHAKRVRLEYRKRGSTAPNTYEASIHALVVKEGVIYGVVTFRDYSDLAHIALHRAIAAELLEKPAARLQGFDLDAYLKTQEAFAYPAGPEQHIRLHLKAVKGVAEHLLERPLSNDQKVVELPSGAMELKATVANTNELRWWLLGFGDSVEVLGPKSLRREMSVVVRRMATAYGAAD